jgi:ATP-grasp ribosomal peptide maturase
MIGKTVLVITHWFDPTADFVVEELNRRKVPVLRFDTADFPRDLRVTGRLGGDGWSGVLRTGKRYADMDTIGGIYFRRPTEFRFGELPEPAARWAHAEARSGLGGLLMTQQRWLNHPHRVGYAEYKPVQLAEAASAGLSVPRTLITNDVAEARAFMSQVGQVIYKPLSAAQPPAAGDRSMLYTSVVEPQHLAEDGDGVSVTMTMFQERVRCQHAVRLTVVDGRMFAAAIHAHSPAAALDWRADQQNLSYSRVAVPDRVASGVAALMTALGLRFGAFDFLATPRGDWVFLEVNPNGQWAFIEQATGLPIASAIADALTEEEFRRDA